MNIHAGIYLYLYVCPNPCTHLLCTRAFALTHARGSVRIKVARPDEYICGVTKEKLHDVLEANIAGPRKVIELYERFAADMSPFPPQSILSIVPAQLDADYKAAQHPLSKYKDDVDRLRQAAGEVMEVTVPECAMGLFNVMTDNVAKEIAAKCTALANLLLNQIVDANVDDMNDIIVRFSKILDEATHTKTKSAAEVKRLKNYLEETVPKELEVCKTKTGDVTRRMDFLFEMSKEISSEDFEMCTEVYKWPTRLQPIVDKAMEDILIAEEKKEDELKARQQKFEDQVNEAVKEIKSYSECGDPLKVNTYLQAVITMRSRLDELEKELVLINEQEKIFGWNMTVNLNVGQGLQDIEPYESFFKAVLDSQNNLNNWSSPAVHSVTPACCALSPAYFVYSRVNPRSALMSFSLAP